MLKLKIVIVRCHDEQDEIKVIIIIIMLASVTRCTSWHRLPIPLGCRYTCWHRVTSHQNQIFSNFRPPNILGLTKTNKSICQFRQFKATNNKSEG